MILDTWQGVPYTLQGDPCAPRQHLHTETFQRSEGGSRSLMTYYKYRKKKTGRIYPVSHSFRQSPPHCTKKHAVPYLKGKKSGKSLSLKTAAFSFNSMCISSVIYVSEKYLFKISRCAFGKSKKTYSNSP